MERPTLQQQSSKWVGCDIYLGPQMFRLHSVPTFSSKTFFSSWPFILFQGD